MFNKDISGQKILTVRIYSIEENENKVIIGFIIISTAIMFILGNPAVLLVLAGAVNGLILPITLAICLCEYIS